MTEPISLAELEQLLAAEPGPCANCDGGGEVRGELCPHCSGTGNAMTLATTRTADAMPELIKIAKAAMAYLAACEAACEARAGLRAALSRVKP